MAPERKHLPPLTVALARVVLATSGLLAASFALLPVAVLLLLTVMDAGAHAFLGMSGALLAVASGWFPGGGGAALPAYQSLRLGVGATLGACLFHAIPPAATVLLATRPLTRRVRRLCVLFAVTGLATAGSWPFAAIALPGVLASFVLLADRRVRA